MPDPELDSDQLDALLADLATNLRAAAPGAPPELTASGRSDGASGARARAREADDGVVELDLQTLRRAYEAGATLNDLAGQLHISNQVVRAFIVAAGGRIRPPITGGRRRQRVRIVGATSHEQIVRIAAAVARQAEVERDTDWDDLW